MRIKDSSARTPRILNTVGPVSGFGENPTSEQCKGGEQKVPGQLEALPGA